MHVIQRGSDNPHISRIQSVHLSQGETFYIRTLLQNRPARSFDELRTVNGLRYPSFQQACLALGIFAEENEAEHCIVEAVTCLRTPRQIRILFIHLLTNECIQAPLRVWDRFRDEMSKDYALEPENHRNPQKALNGALDEIGRLLEEFGKTLNYYGLPQPSSHPDEVVHERSRWSSQAVDLLARSVNASDLFNPEQQAVHNLILRSIDERRPLLVFVDGKAGRGKTFLVNVLCDWLRGMGEIVLATATSAFAAQLYPGGRTTHSTFKVPVNERNEMIISPIQAESPRGRLIKEAALIVWDEAPMANRAVLGCVEEVCRRIMGINLPFGGKVIVLLGDFRQTCPVIRRGTRAQIVNASIRSSELWHHFNIQRLTTPIRNAEDPQFAEFVDAVGDGAGPQVELLFLWRATNHENLIDFVYPPAILASPIHCLRRAILAPLNHQVDHYNKLILDQLPGQQRTYFAADSLQEREDIAAEADEDHPLPTPDAILDYVACIRPHGMPDHTLIIKVGGSISSSGTSLLTAAW